MELIDADINQCYMLTIYCAGPLSTFCDQIEAQPTVVTPPIGYICFTGGAMEEILDVAYLDDGVIEYNTRRGLYREKHIVEDTSWGGPYEHTVYERLLGVRGWVPCTLLIREIMLRREK